MANWSNPTLTSLYTDFVTEVKNRDVDLALGLDPATTSPTNVPTNAIRWNSASFKYQKWDGSTWNDLSAKYIFTAVEVSGFTVPVNGMYLSATNTLNFSTASTASRLTIDGSGNVNIDSGTFYVDAVNNRVGIGTTGPVAGTLIDAYQALYPLINTRCNGNGAAGYGSSTDNQTNLWFFGARKDSIGGAIGTDRFNLLYNTSNLITVDTSGNLGLGVVPSTYSVGKTLELGTKGNSIWGLGTNSLWLASNTYFDGSYRYANNGFANLYRVGADNGQFQWLTAAANTTGTAITFTQAMTLDASGNLGVGMTNPGYRFDVTGPTSSFAGVRVNSSSFQDTGFIANRATTGNTSGLYFTEAGTNKAYILNYGSAYGSGLSNALQIVNGSTSVTFNATGNVGIGTTSPVAALHSRTDNAGSGSTPLLIQNRSVSANTAVGISFAPNTSDTADRSAVIYGVNSSGGTGNATDLAFHTNANGGPPTEKARINSLGYMQGTVNGLGAGRIPAKQYYRLNTQYTGSNVNTAQPVFGVGVTLVGSTVYEFEALYLLAGVTTTSCAMSLLFGGTATVNNIMYKGAGFGQGGAFSTSDLGTGDGFYSRVASAAQVAVGLLSAVTVSYIIKGTVSINAGGTFIPQYIFSAVPGNAFITDIGSYFSIWPLGASGSNTSIGTWA